jgi:lysophospholipid acyltransferase (LPLAT)-like uncharacterized protein
LSQTVGQSPACRNAVIIGRQEPALQEIEQLITIGKDAMSSLQNYVTKLGGYSLAQGAALWMDTLEFQGAYFDRTIDTTFTGFQGPVILLLWHEYILFPFYLRRHNDMAILLSQHRDADWLHEAARHRGFSTVRGSTTRGGAAALRELMQLTKTKNLAITPDGPRGPRRKMSQGPIFLSSKLQIPLVCCGMGYYRPWRMRTWDRFAIPVPFTRARGIASPRLQIPANLDREGLEHYRQQTEDMLNHLCECAEDWANTGRSPENAVRLRAEPRPWWYDCEREASLESQGSEPSQEARNTHDGAHILRLKQAA